MYVYMLQLDDIKDRARRLSQQTLFVTDAPAAPCIAARALATPPVRVSSTASSIEAVTVHNSADVIHTQSQQQQTSVTLLASVVIVTTT